MKILIKLMLGLVLVSCNKEPIETKKPNETSETNNELDKIEIDDILHLMPLDTLAGISKVIFTSEDSNEIVMTIEIRDTVKPKRTATKTYEAEEVSIVYRPDPQSNFYMFILALGSYTPEEKSQLSISCSLVQWTGGYSPGMSISSKGTPLLALFHDSITIAGKEFKGIFSIMPVPGFERFSEVYYSPQLGVVGFEDGNGEIFSLSEIVE